MATDAERKLRVLRQMLPQLIADWERRQSDCAEGARASVGDKRQQLGGRAVGIRDCLTDLRQIDEYLRAPPPGQRERRKGLRLVVTNGQGKKDPA